MADSPVGILRSELNGLLTEIEAITAEHEVPYPPEVLERWNLKNKMVDEYKVRIEQAVINERTAELKALANNDKAREPIGKDFQIERPGAYRGDLYDLSTIDRDWSNPGKEGQQFRDRALRVAQEKLSYRDSNLEPDKAKEHVTGLIERVDSEAGELSRHLIVNSSERYKQALGKYIAGAFLTTEENKALNESRALSLTSAAGGYAVPVELDPTIMPTSSLAINPLRGISTVRQVTVDTFNGVTSGAVTANYQAEASATTESSPTIGQILISTERASAFIAFSIEIGQDWGALQAEMGRLLQDAKDVLEATAFTTGSGTNQPYGIITGATTVFTGSSATGITLADLTNWDETLPPRFQPRASAMFTKTFANRLRRLDAGVTGGAGSAVWIPNLTLSSGNEGRASGRFGADFLGYPAYQNTAMSSAMTTGTLPAIIGDFSYFYIIDRIGMNIETIPHLFEATNNNPTGQRGLYCYWRNGAKIVDAAAFRTLKLG